MAPRGLHGPFVALFGRQPDTVQATWPVYGAIVTTCGSVLAVDIGGTKMAASIIDDDGSLTSRVQRATVADSADALFEGLAAVIDETLDTQRSKGGPLPVAMGVGCGGPMTPDGQTVSPLNIEVWRDFPLRERLGERFGLPVWIDNDAKALALGEGWLGAARGHENYLAMVVSTGVGGGLVLDGKLIDGESGNAGHIGHVVVVPDGRACVCGSRGCLEAEASGLAISAITGRPPSEATDEVRARTGRLVGRAVAAVVTLTDIRLVCIAGSVALGFGAPFFEAAEAELASIATIPFARGARIVPAGLGGDGPLVGAAMVARRHLID